MQTFVLQGNMIGRKDENGPQGDGVNEDVCFTLDATDRHAVCAPEDVYAMTTGSLYAGGKRSRTDPDGTGLQRPDHHRTGTAFERGCHGNGGNRGTSQRLQRAGCFQ